MAVKISITIEENEDGMRTRITRKAEKATTAEGLLSAILIKMIDFITSHREDDDE